MAAIGTLKEEATADATPHPSRLRDMLRVSRRRLAAQPPMAAPSASL